jgi:hypothetical protein
VSNGDYARFARHRGRQPLANCIPGLPDGIRGEVSVPGRRSRVRVAEQTTDDEKRLPQPSTHGCKGMAQIMQPDVIQCSTLT